MDRYKKIIIGVTAGGLIAGSIYLVYKQYCKRGSSKDADEGFSDSDDPGSGELLPKRILVLGLDKSGKSALLSVLSSQTPALDYNPTEGFNVITVQNGKTSKNLDMWEIGGASKVRKYWPNFIQDTDVLVFVIDSSDRKRFAEAYDEMHKLLGETRLEEKPFLVLANKQDLDNAANTAEVKEALGLEDVKHHGVMIVETSLTSQTKVGVDKVKQLLSTW